MAHPALSICAALAAAGMVLVATPASAADDFFRSPTGNIGCAHAGDLGTLRCDVRDGVKPLPPMPKSCEYEWGQGFWLHNTGSASSSSGFRCNNAGGHGFFISRGEAYRF